MELKKVAQDLGEDLTDEEIEKMFVKADLDDDGLVTADDFYNIMTHRVYWDQWYAWFTYPLLLSYKSFTTVILIFKSSNPMLENQ